MVTRPELAVVLCCGSFHHPHHYQPLIDALRNENFIVECPSLPTMNIPSIIPPMASTLSQSTKFPNGYDDVRTVQSSVYALADAGHRILLVGHSYGGFLATECAIPDLQYRNRQARKEQGGVVGLFYITGAILSKGQSMESFFKPPGEDPPLPPFVARHVRLARLLIIYVPLTRCPSEHTKGPTLFL